MLIYDFIVNQSAAGVSQDQLITELVNALSVISTSDHNWGQAAIQHNINGINKILDHLLADTFAKQSGYREGSYDHADHEWWNPRRNNNMGGQYGGNVDLDNIV